MNGKRHGITLLELLVVMAILGLLATVATAVYSGHVLRAKVAAAATQIHSLELACAQYEVDTGQFPPSSSGTRLAPGAIDPSNVPGQGAIGCGYMITALKASLSGDPNNPSDPRWRGPYIEISQSRVGLLPNGLPLDPTVTYPMPTIQLLDPWGMPYYYVRSVDYATFLGTRVPPNSPFATDVWFNPSTFQIVSFGPNQFSPARPNLGTDVDDPTNFRF